MASKTKRVRPPFKRKLTPKARSFAVEFLKDQSPMKAYQRVFGGSDEVASASGSRLLADARIQAIVQKGLARAAERANVTAEKNLARIAGIAYDNKKAGLNTVLKACELVGKALGQFKEVSEQKLEVSVVDQAEVKAMREKIKGDC